MAQTKIDRHGRCWPLWLAMLLLGVPIASAQRSTPPDDLLAPNFQAGRLLSRGEDLLKAGEHERGVRMLQTVIEQYPRSREKYQSYLALGKHGLETHQEAEAISYLNRVRELPGLMGDDQPLPADLLEVYLEGSYLMGIAYYNTKQYAATYPVLRKITREYPNTIWANQAYYYIGMCHFAEKNWNKAIEALQLVGTFVDADSDSLQYVEAGQRLYLKVTDRDLPVLARMGLTIDIDIVTSAGDKERITCIPMSRSGDLALGSIATQIGLPNAESDNLLQVRGGDTIEATYVDNSTYEGEHNLPRLQKTRVVSTGTVSFTMGTFEGQAAAAFMGQPTFILVHDADLDKSNEADQATVTVVSRYQLDPEQSAAPGLDELDVDALLGGEERREGEQFVVRDQVVVPLRELGEAPVHTGRFGGSVVLERGSALGEEADPTDQILRCLIGDQVVVSYSDELHLGGERPITRTAMLEVAGEVDSSPRPTQRLVPDPVLRARMNLVEGAAYLELTRIFRDMGLSDGAEARGQEAIARLDEVIAMRDDITVSLVEQAYQRKWETQMAVRDYAGALGTCHQFNQLFPDSPLVDQALKEVAMIHLENDNHAAAAGIFKRILALEYSLVKAEAMYRLGECTEKLNSTRPEAAIAIYQRCATEFPDSSFAGAAIAKQIDFYYGQDNLTTADQLLEQVFIDYPDADFLDAMLIKWVLVAYKMGNHQKALAKARKLVFEYPDSAYAANARQYIPKLEAKVQQAATTNGE